MKRLRFCLFIGLLMISLIVVGCTGGQEALQQEEAEENLVVYSSFYPLYDLVNKIGSDRVDAELVVPHGTEVHSYEPSSRKIAQIEQGDLFLYNGLELEPWADRLVENLSYTESKTINASDFVKVLEYGDHDHDHSHDHQGVDKVELIDRSQDQVIADSHNDHWHGSIPEIKVGEHISLGAIFRDDHGHQITLGNNEKYQFNARIDFHSPEGVVEVVSHGDHLHLRGESVGEVAVIFQLWHDEHADWESPEMTVKVVEDRGHSYEDDDNTHSHCDHGHGEYDPHIWLNPINMRLIAERLVEELSELDPEGEELYRANYNKFAQEIEELDQEYKEVLANRNSDYILVSHSAFQYLAERYGMQEFSVAGVSPHQEPTPAALARLSKEVKKHELEYIFLEVLASPRTAEVLAEEADLEVLKLNPIEGLRPEDVEAGEDYFSIMRKNLTTLEKALVN
ncbi:zinc ABC transporter substrate-binding protein [Natroniella acetigena]|uniref:metal ABC transporter solute-binding protein, Zn/Mn family n=1 Tax=Natroniella acetigena TaxID=52004 RepID=UPI00200A67AB|nr:zinc ABC transporter substrate-binding protein [Natroniella acetigena]MCK8826499.1 zinc ABC transporter substrate-binding protein [Natroniella acetigena]